VDSRQRQTDIALIAVYNIQGSPKRNPYEKFDICGIVADIFTKFAEFTDEDSVHISCKFCWNNTWCERDNSFNFKVHFFKWTYSRVLNIQQ